MVEKQKKIILGVTGSIAAYKSADILRFFQNKRIAVTVVMTKEAEYFITALTLSALSGIEAYRWGGKFENNAWQMQHVQLVKEADALVVAPATANIIGKFASGISDDLLTCLFLSMDPSKVYMAPAMNESMYKNKIVVENCQRLKKIGVRFIEPIKGKLACGIIGDGHIADAEDIVEAVIKEKFYR